MCIYVCLVSVCPVEDVVGCRELVGRFVHVGNQECEGGHLFILAKESHLGFVWECDDENAEAECRTPTNPLDKMFLFYEDIFGWLNCYMVSPCFPRGVYL